MKQGLIKGAMGTEPEADETQAHEGGETPGYEKTEDVNGEAAEQPDGNESEGPDSEDPGYTQAMDLVMQILYKEGGAKNISQAMAKASNPVEIMANLAYDIVMAADEKTEGSVPDELITTFAAETLGEVADIAEASGAQFGGREIAEAMKIMMLRYVTDNGLDSSQLQQSMGTVDTAQLGPQLEQQFGGGAK